MKSKNKQGGQIKYPLPKLGTQFDYWEVIGDKVEKVEPNRMVMCRCKCGTERLVRLPALLNGLSKGCECRAFDIRRSQTISEGDLSLTLYGRFKKSAKTRGIEWDVSMKYLWELYQDQDGKCALSGLELKLETSLNRKKGESNITASLDRIDSDEGYTKDNVQWVHKDVNKMKQDLSEERLIELSKLIVSIA